MTDRLINEDAVLALIDAKLEKSEALLTNKYASQADRRVLASNICVLRAIREGLGSVPTEEYTEADKLAMVPQEQAA